MDLEEIVDILDDQVQQETKTKSICLRLIVRILKVLKTTITIYTAKASSSLRLPNGFGKLPISMLKLIKMLTMKFPSRFVHSTTYSRILHTCTFPISRYSHLGQGLRNFVRKVTKPQSAR